MLVSSLLLSPTPAGEPKRLVKLNEAWPINTCNGAEPPTSPLWLLCTTNWVQLRTLQTLQDLQYLPAEEQHLGHYLRIPRAR